MVKLDHYQSVLIWRKERTSLSFTIYPPSPSPYPEVPFPTKSLSHAKPMNCDTLQLLGRDNGEQKAGERYGEQPWLRLLHSPYEDEWKEPWWREGGWSGTRKETKQNPAHGGPCPWEKVCVSVCKCVCGCADLALLSEGCIRVACRKGHRTTVVLQQKK